MLPYDEPLWLYSLIVTRHTVHWANMTSFTKPEVHNVLHCRQRRTEPRPLLTCTGNFVKFGHVILEICKRTGRHAHSNTSNPPGGEVTSLFVWTTLNSVLIGGLYNSSVARKMTLFTPLRTLHCVNWELDSICDWQTSAVMMWNAQCCF